jgi:hypothetical protein
MVLACGVFPALAGCVSGSGESTMRSQVEVILAAEGFGSVDVDTLTDQQVTEIYLVEQREEVAEKRSLVGAILRRG